MPLYKRKDSPSWWFKITSAQVRGLPKPVVGSSGCTKKRDAQEVEDALIARLRQQYSLGGRPSRSWDEAALRWLEETTHKRDHHGDIQRIRDLTETLSGLDLTSINQETVNQALAAVGKNTLRPPSRNRYYATVRAILNRAADTWDWIDRAPKFQMLAENKDRWRYLTYDEAARLLEALPAHLKDPAEFMLLTGLRLSDCFGLTWRQVDTARGVAWRESGETKGGKGLPIPLVDRAVELLVAQQGNHPDAVWTWRGQPMRRPDTRTWKAACERAGLQGLRIHDLRHTWATWHVQEGTDVRTLKELGGWADISMVFRYAHVSAEHLQATARNLGAVRLRERTAEFRRRLGEAA